MGVWWQIMNEKGLYFRYFRTVLRPLVERYCVGQVMSMTFRIMCDSGTHRASYCALQRLGKNCVIYRLANEIGSARPFFFADLPHCDYA